MTTRTSAAVSTTMLGGLPRSGIHLARPVALRLLSAVGTGNLFVAVFYELFELFVARRTSVL